MADPDGELIEVAECPYGCGELHEMRDVGSELGLQVLTCRKAPRTARLFPQGMRRHWVRLSPHRGR